MEYLINPNDSKYFIDHKYNTLIVSKTVQKQNFSSALSRLASAVYAMECLCSLGYGWTWERTQMSLKMAARRNVIRVEFYERGEWKSWLPTSFIYCLSGNRYKKEYKNISSKFMSLYISWTSI